MSSVKKATSAISFNAMSCKFVTPSVLILEGKLALGNFPRLCCSIAKSWVALGLGKPSERGKVGLEDARRDNRDMTKVLRDILNLMHTKPWAMENGTWMAPTGLLRVYEKPKIVMISG
jgi:hypothetical protein